MITLADAWLHDLSPFIFRISGEFGLRWYGMSYAAGFFLGWVALRWLIARGAVQISKERAVDVVVYAAIGAIAGGRLGYAVFYQPSLLWSFDGDLPFWGLLKMNQGGMASHGGMIGVAIASWIVARGPRGDDGGRPERVSFFHVIDIYALIAPVGLMLGRLANFINGELLGSIVAKPGEPAPSWAVRYPQEITTGHAPELSLEQQDRLLGLIDDYRLDPTEADASAYERVLRELQSGSVEVAERLGPLISARHPSQLYQAAAEGVVLGLAVWLFARKPRRPGQIMGLGLVVYGVLRIVTELYRLPDAHLEIQRYLGLSRGQLLSAAMITIGVGLFVWAGSRGGPRQGGWVKAGPGKAGDIETTNGTVSEKREQATKESSHGDDR